MQYPKKIDRYLLPFKRWRLERDLRALPLSSPQSLLELLQRFNYLEQNDSYVNQHARSPQMTIEIITWYRDSLVLVWEHAKEQSKFSTRDAAAWKKIMGECNELHRRYGKLLDSFRRAPLAA